MHYSDDFTTSTSQQGSPNQFTRDSFWRADVVASIAKQGGQWSVSLVGRNLSDEIYTVETVGRRARFQTPWVSATKRIL